MSAWLRNPRGSVAIAIAIAAVLIGLWLVPIVRQHQSAGFAPGAGGPSAAVAPQPSADRVSADATAPSQVPRATGSDVDAVTRSGPDRPERPAAIEIHPGQATSGTVPAFDVVRVDPHGDAVIAGRAAPGAEVELVDGGKVVGKVVADAGGQFVLLPPSLAAGDHYLTLQVTRGGGTALSIQGVAVSVAPDASKPMVAVLTPDQPARVLSDGAPRGPEATATSTRPVATNASTASAPRPVAIQSVETGGRGTFTASGVAKAGSQCRLYLNGAFLADVTAGADGRWSVKVEKGMKAGKYTVRADQLADATGRVVDRAEVPFDFPATVAIGRAKQLLMAHASPAGVGPRQSGSSGPVLLASADPAAKTAPSLDDASAAAAIVRDVQSATVIHGDSLWRISRKMLGHGINYTEIYASNVGQIRNPRMIYPGQIFVLPHRPTREGLATP